MTSPAFDRLSSGYYNPGLRAASNPGGMSGPGAMRLNWPLMLADLAVVVAEGAISAEEAQEAAASAILSPTTKASSITAMTVPAAVPETLTFRIEEADKGFSTGQTVVVSGAPPNALNAFYGPVTAWDPATRWMTVRALFASGAGEFAAWRIALSAPVDGTLTGRVAALEQSNAEQRDAALFYAKEFI